MSTQGVETFKQISILVSLNFFKYLDAVWNSSWDSSKIFLVCLQYQTENIGDTENIFQKADFENCFSSSKVDL